MVKAAQPVAEEIEYKEISGDEPLTESQFEQQISHDISQFYDDFHGFVMYAFPWGEKGTELEEHSGPDKWQREQQERVSAKVRRDPEGTIREAIASGHGIGKGLTCDSIAHRLKFNLVNKFEVSEMELINWGDLKKGDFVFGANGKPTKIIATNRYRREHFKVMFDDGSTAIVSGEHEWVVKGRQERRKGLNEWRVLETEEILEFGVKRSNGKTLARQWEIPIQGAVEFVEADLNVHPYFMGLWLGDGCRNEPKYVKPFPELAKRLCAVSGYHTSYAPEQKGATRILLRQLGITQKEFLADPIFNEYSQNRYIPENYKFASVEQRTELFKGLCDSDGEVHKSGSIGYSSASKQLALDIIWLARSLGCKAMLQPTIKTPVFIDSNGEKVKGRDCYRVTINCSFNPFTHPKRKLAYKPSEERYRKRWIESIESVGMKDGMCITVASKDHLYLTNDFIVTHNSAEVAWLILWAMSTRPHLAGVITANTTNQLNTKTWRELALWHKRMINAHWFKWTATKFFHVDHPETWACHATPNTEHNSEAFAGLHGTHVLIIYDEACHDDQTDVLTDKGWVRFEQLTGEEKLLTMDPETQHTFYEKPAALIRHDYDGEMYSMERRGANYCITPNHRMLCRSYAGRQDGRRTDWKLIPISEMSEGGGHFIQKTIGQRTAVEQEFFELSEYESARKTYPRTKIPMDVWLDFLGWYLSEGHLVYSTNNTPVTIVLSQSPKSPGLDWMLNSFENLAECAGKSIAQYGENQYALHHAPIAKHLAAYGRRAINKQMPEYVRTLTPRQQRIFLESFIAGDGYWREINAVMYTSSPEMASQLQEIALLCGGTATVTQREPSGVIDFGTHTAMSLAPGYIVYWNPATDENSCITIGKGRGLGERVHYQGKVYCATMPSHGVMFTRRNGRCMWSGNSGIPDKIWEVSEGAMTDPRAMWFVYGNPTKNTGKFRDIHANDARWTCNQIDSRTCKMTNKKEINAMIAEYGEDSDFCRVRVKGQFPRAGSMQFIASDICDIAMLSEAPYESFFQMPIILGVDVARFGEDKSVIAVRQGRKIIELIRYRDMDTMQLSAKVVRAIREYSPAVTFVDSVGVGAGVVDRLRMLGHDIIEVNAGMKPDDEKTYYNKRAEMWDRMRIQIREGMDLPNDADLRNALIGVEYGFDDKERMRLERKRDMKKRGLESPDDGDAIAYTYAELIGDHNQRYFEPDDSFDPN